MKHISLFLFFFCCLSFGQKQVNIDSLNKLIEIKPIYLSEGLEINSIDQSQLKWNQFQIENLENSEIGKEYWSTFLLHPKKNIQVAILEFSFPLSDKMEVFVPLKSGEYKVFLVGMSTKVPKLFKIEQLSTFYIEASSLDFNKPFFTKNIPMSFFGLESLDNSSYIMARGSPPPELQDTVKDKLYERSTFEYEFVLLLGMIMISFVFMLVHYIISKRIYFLFYSLYLFFLIFNYGYRTFYFYNIYSQIHINLYFYLNQNGQLLSFLCYMLFVKYFVDIKRNYPRLNIFYNITIWIFGGFITIYNLIIIIDPYFSYHEIIMKGAIYILTLLSLGFVFYMFFKKRLVHTAVVFIGSIILLLGYLTAIIAQEFFILVPLVVVETIFFISVIAYLDLRNFKRGVEADKLKEIDEFKSRFFTNISHEFRTPLTLISGPIQSHLSSPNLNSGQRKNLNIALRNANRLNDLIDQLLILSKLENKRLNLNVNHSNMPHFLWDQAERFSFSCSEKKISYSIEVKNDEIVDWFDQDVMEKIFYNLIGNAIKYTPSGGSITISGSRKDDMYKIAVQNSDSFIDREQRQKIYDRFYQSNSNTPGAGIGLALTKELVELHHGSIALNSEENGLTVFTVEIPTQKNSYAPEEIFYEEISEQENLHIDNMLDSEKITQAPENAPVLLIVDDNKDICEYVQSIFNSNYVVQTAKDGKEGLKNALETIPDIVISDIMMPEEDGFIFTKRLKKNPLTSHIPVILLTAKSQIASKMEGLETGADAYVTKPFNPELLKANVANLIENRRKLHRRFTQEVILTPKDIAISSADEQFLERLQKVLDDHLTEPNFSAEIFGDKMGVSRMQLHRKLKALTGQATTEFIRSQRLKLALNLMKSNKLTVSEVGYAVGFNDPAYFTRCFKQQYGVSPSEFLSN